MLIFNNGFMISQKVCNHYIIDGVSLTGFYAYDRVSQTDKSTMQHIRTSAVLNVGHRLKARSPVAGNLKAAVRCCHAGIGVENLKG